MEQVVDDEITGDPISKETNENDNVAPGRWLSL